MFLFKLFAGKTFEELVKEAQDLFDQQQWGEARLSYLKALKKIKNNEDQKIKIDEKIKECCFHLASIKLEKAKEYISAGHPQLAIEALEDSLEICEDKKIIEQISRLKAEFEIISEEINEEDEIQEDEFLQIIEGKWNEAQKKEYNLMPNPFMQNFLASHEGKHQEAIEYIETALKEAPASICRYVYFDLGKEKFLIGDLEGSKKEMETFLELSKSDTLATDQRIAAHTLIATIFVDSKQMDKAEQFLLAAFKCDTSNHVSLINLGRFLREQKDFKRSKKTLENARDIMSSVHPDLRVYTELGLTLLAMGEKKEAIEYLEVSTKSSCGTGGCGGGDHLLDPQAAVPLARLYEEKGQLILASDLYRHLVNGYDLENKPVYCVEAARLLSLQKAPKELIDNYLEMAKDLSTQTPTP